MSTEYLSDVASDLLSPGVKALLDGIRGIASVAHVTPTKLSATSVQEMQAAAQFLAAASTANNGGSNTTMTQTLGAANTEGETLLCFTTWGDSGSATGQPVITDNATSQGGRHKNVWHFIPGTYLRDGGNGQSCAAFYCYNAVKTASAITVTATWPTASPFLGVAVTRHRPSIIDVTTGGVVNTICHLGTTSGTSANNVTAGGSVNPSTTDCEVVTHVSNMSDGSAITAGTTLAWTNRTSTSTPNVVTMVETFVQQTATSVAPTARIATTGINYILTAITLRPTRISYLSQVYAPGTNITGNMTASLRGKENNAANNAAMGGLLEVVDRYGKNILATLKAETIFPASSNEFTTTDAAKALASTAVTAFNPPVPWRYRWTTKIKNATSTTMAADAIGVTTTVGGPTASAAGDSSVVPPTTQTAWHDPAKPYAASVTVDGNGNGAGQDKITPAVPSGVVNGSLLIAYVAGWWAQNTTAPTDAALGLPTGWHLGHTTFSFIDTGDGVYFGVWACYKWATGSDSGTYEFDFNAVGSTSQVSGVYGTVKRIVNCTAANGTNPFDSVTFDSIGSVSAATGLGTTSATPSQNNNLVDVIGSAFTTNGLAAPDGTVPLRSDVFSDPTGIALFQAQIQQDAAAPTGSIRWIGDSTSWMWSLTAVLLGTNTPEIASHGAIFNGDGSTITTAETPVPADVVSGSLVVVNVAVYWLEGGVAPTDVGWTLPSGFASGAYNVFHDTANSSYDGSFWFYKYASGADDPDTTYDFTTPQFSSTDGFIVTAKAFRIVGGPTSGNPFSDSLRFASAVSGSSLSMSTFTPGGADSLFLADSHIVMASGGVSEWSWPAFPLFPIDRCDDTTQTVSSVYGFGSQLTAAATGSLVFDPVGAYTSIWASLVTIRPPAGGPVTGTAAVGLGAMSIAATGTRKVLGSAAVGLGAMSIAAAGTVHVHDTGRALLSNPRLDHDAVNKKYVDDALAALGPSYFAGNVEAGSGFTQLDYRLIYDFTDTGSGVTAYFPAPVAGGGWVIAKNNVASVQAITIYCNNGEELDDGNNAITLQPGDGYIAFNDGANWIGFKTTSVTYASTLAYVAKTADFDASGANDYLVTPASGDVVATLQPPTKAGMMLFKLSPSATYKLTVRAHVGYNLDGVSSGFVTLSTPGDSLWVIGRDDFDGWLSLKAVSTDSGGNQIGVTKSPGDSTTALATTEYTDLAIAALVNSAPGALDTLKELADALGDDANYAATITAALALKAPLASPALTGNPTAPTQTPGNNSTRLATTAFVTDAAATAVTDATSIAAAASSSFTMAVAQPINNVVTKTANYTAVAGDVVLVNAASGNVTITVPKTANAQVTVKRIDSSTHTVTVVASSGTIDGDANATLVGIEAAGTFVGDGTNVQVTSVNGSLFANATSANTASTLALRDSAGRTQFGDPSAAQDAATKNYVDAGRLAAFVNAFVASMAPGTSYLADASGGSFNMNLPGSPVAGQRWKVAKYDQSVNAVGIVFPFGSTCYYLGSLVTSLTMGLSFCGDSVDIGYDGTHYIAIPASAAQPYQTWTPTLTQNGSAVAKTVNFARWNRIAGRIHAYCQLTPSAAGAVGFIAVGLPVQPLNNAQPLSGQFWWLHGNHYSGFPSVYGSLGSYAVIGIGSQPSSPTSTAMGAGLPAAAISSGDTIGYSIIYEG